MNQWMMEATLQDTTPHLIAWRVAVIWGAHSHVIDVDVVEMIAAIQQLVASNAKPGGCRRWPRSQLRHYLLLVTCPAPMRELVGRPLSHSGAPAPGR
jgi:hypothetical protein